MIKKDELSQPNSCMSKAHPEEMVFVLRAKDPSQPRILYGNGLRTE